jgi:hypothetical protein
VATLAKKHAGISVLNDIIFAFMPIILISTLGRALVERILVSILMALGLVAATGAAVRLWVTKEALEDTNHLRSTLKIVIWCRMEESVLAIAACTPLLKSSIEKVLSRLGLRMFKNMPRKLNTIQSPSLESERAHWHAAELEASSE